MGLQEDSAGVFQAVLADTDVFGEPVTFRFNDGTAETELDCTVLRDGNENREWDGGDSKQEMATVHVSAKADATGIVDASTISQVELSDGKIFLVDIPTSGQGGGCHILKLIATETRDRFDRNRMAR